MASFQLKIYHAFKKSVQPQTNNESHRDANPNKHALHHRADGLIAFRQFGGGVELRQVVDDSVAHIHEENGDDAAENGVDEIQQNDAGFHAPSFQ